MYEAITMFSGVTDAHMNKTTPLHVVSLTWTWSVPSFSPLPSSIGYSLQPFHNFLRFHGYWSFHLPLSWPTLLLPVGMCSYTDSKPRVSFNPMNCCVYWSVYRDNVWYVRSKVSLGKFCVMHQGRKNNNNVTLLTYLLTYLNHGVETFLRS